MAPKSRDRGVDVAISESRSIWLCSLIEIWTAVCLVCPRICSTDLDVLICKEIDGPLASADQVGCLEEERRRDGQAERLSGLE
jgi:hypothetical protein